MKLPVSKSVMVARMLVVLVAGGLAGCGMHVRAPRYASWEPLSTKIPAVDREQALSRLTQSRQLWKQWCPEIRPLFLGPRGPDRPYTYVRARQRSLHRVDFTVIAVSEDRVVLRTLVTVDPHQLSDDWTSRDLEHAESRWVERGDAIGSHDEGAPAQTIDELYDACERLLAGHPYRKPRLYFHPDGLLMQCGLTPGCPDCTAVSLQSVSPLSASHEDHIEVPDQWLCSAPWGVFPPGARDPLSGPARSCRPAHGLRSYAVSQPKPSSGLSSICQIDPDACPNPVTDHATWVDLGPMVSYVSDWQPSHPPTYVEVGKPAPLDEWVFPGYWTTTDDLSTRSTRSPGALHIRPRLR